MISAAWSDGTRPAPALLGSSLPARPGGYQLDDAPPPLELPPPPDQPELDPDEDENDEPEL